MRFKYIDTEGQTRTIEAVDAQSALTSAVNIAPNSGVVLETTVSPVTNNGVDLSLVGNIGALVPVPVLPPPVVPAQPFATTPQVTVVSFKDNADGTTTNFYSDGTSETGRLAIGTDGQATFNPGGNVLTAGIDTVREQIKVIEDRMIGRTTDRADLLEQADVFSNMRELNRLNDELRVAQSRKTGIPLEQREKLKGGRSRPATTAELEQATRPGLEKALLRELTASSQSARLNDSIETNIKIIDTQLEGEKARDEFIYKQKQDYLKTLETNYANIITEEQKIALEERKFQNDISKINVQLVADLKKEAIKELPKSLFAKSGFSESVMDMSLDEIYGLTATYSGTQSFLEMSPSEAYSTLTGDKLKSYEAYQKFGAEQKKVIDIESAKAGSTAEIVDQINKMLNDTEGLSNSVGFGLGNMDARLRWTPLGVEADDFHADALQLIKKLGNQALADLRATGVAPGPITEREWTRFDQLGSKLSVWSIDDDKENPTGRFEVKEATFIKAMQDIQDAALRLNLISNIGEEAFVSQGYANASRETLLLKYEDIKSNPTESSIFQRRQQFNSSFDSSDPSTSLLRLSEAIATQESGGDYGAVGPVVTSGAYQGERALGKYQIMPSNIPLWSRDVLGRIITPEEFYRNPALQDQLAMAKIYQLMNQYDNPADVASVWFSGQPLSGNNASDVTGTSVPKYVQSVMRYFNS